MSAVLSGRRMRLAGVVLAGTLLAACGVPAEDEPHAIDLPRRPFTSSSPSAATAEPPGEVAEVLCLVRDGRLVQTVRRIETTPSAQQQADHLVAGPTDSEQQIGLTTALAGWSLQVEVTGTRLARVAVGLARDHRLQRRGVQLHDREPVLQGDALLLGHPGRGGVALRWLSSAPARIETRVSLVE